MFSPASITFLTNFISILHAAFYDANYDGTYNEEDLSIVVNQGRTITAGAEVKF